MKILPYFAAVCAVAAYFLLLGRSQKPERMAATVTRTQWTCRTTIQRLDHDLYEPEFETWTDVASSQDASGDGFAYACQHLAVPNDHYREAFRLVFYVTFADQHASRKELRLSTKNYSLFCQFTVGSHWNVSYRNREIINAEPLR